MKNSCYLLVACTIAPGAMFAQDEAIAGNLVVAQSLSVGQDFHLGQAVLGDTAFPALRLQTDSIGGVTFVNTLAYGTVTTWEWLLHNGTSTRRVMSLEDNGRVLIFSPSNATTPAIVLDAGNATTPRITIKGQNVLTEQALGTVLQTGPNAQVSLGNGASATGWYSTAIGNQTEASGNYYATAIGYSAHAFGEYNSMAIGSGAYAFGEYNAMAIGMDSIASGEYNVMAIGYNAYALGNYHTIAIGPYAVAWGESNSMAIGTFASASGNENSMAIGPSAYASNDNTIALGMAASAQGDSSIAIGKYTWTDSNTSNQIAIGAYNNPLPGMAFMIGNGTGEWGYNPNSGHYESGYSNLFVIMNDGKGIFRHKDYIEPNAANPFPEQGEALLVEGSATIKGNLTLNGTFSLYHPDNPSTPVISLNASDASTPRITINGQNVLTEQALGTVLQTGPNAQVSLGNGASATGNFSIALGTSANTANYAATALGASSSASGYASVALGYQAEASNNYATAIGYYARASGYYDSMAIGTYASAYGDYNSTAIGYYAHASGYYDSMAIGTYADASGDYNSMAIGSGAYASGDYSAMAIGTGAYASGEYYSIAIGSGAYASNAYTIALGSSASAQGDSSIAIGKYAQTDSNTPNQIALGTYNKPLPNAAFMIGNGIGGWTWDPNTNSYQENRSNLLVLMNDGSLSLYNPGDTTTPVISFDTSDADNPRILFNGQSILPAQGGGGGFSGNVGVAENGSIAIGNNASAYEGESASALGSYATASEYGSLAVGYYSSSTGYSTTALGRSAYANGSSSAAVGVGASTYGDYSLALGYYSSAYDESSMAIGRYAYASGINSIALGYGAMTDYYSSGQIVMGSYNEIVPDAAFMIGNGTGEWAYDPGLGYSTENRSNLFVIMNDGKAVLQHKDYVEPDRYNDVPAGGGEALRVKGSAVVEGKLLVMPAGELSMGIFTDGEQP